MSRSSRDALNNVSSGRIKSLVLFSGRVTGVTGLNAPIAPAQTPIRGGCTGGLVFVSVLSQLAAMLSSPGPCLVVCIALWVIQSISTHVVTVIAGSRPTIEVHSKDTKVKVAFPKVPLPLDSSGK